MHRSITKLKGVGPAKAQVFAEIGIESIADLLYYFPRRYIDRTLMEDGSAIEPGKETTLIVTIVGSFLAHGKRSRLMVKCRTSSGDPVTLIWFNAVRFFQKQLQDGLTLVVSGKLEYYGGLQILHPDFEILDEKDASDLLHVGRIVPVYPSSETLKKSGMDSRGFRRLISAAFEISDLEIVETIPSALMHERGLVDRETSLRNLHYPESMKALDEARYRLKYEELYLFGVLMHRKEEKRKSFERELWPLSSGQSNDAKSLEESLPFELTGEQKKAIGEILEYFGEDHPESVLLQGDVGSGKTLVALLVALHYLENRIQVAILAPTEVLARQHFRTITNYLGMESGYRVELLTGSDTKRQKAMVVEGLSGGDVDLVVGTHSLIEESVSFRELGLVVIDEQHRFGVEQREKLRRKGKNPDMIAMTATPIPRTLCLTEFADLNLVSIKEKPAGRKPIKTMWLKEGRRAGLYKSIRNHINSGRQAYIVYPLIDESEKTDLKAATDAWQELRTVHFPDHRVELLHGKMKAVEKDRIMASFRNGLVQILVTTTVIEVGVDVQNATIMVIEHAERFGISQLHQLRGRVGRGSEESFCVLMTPDQVSEDGEKRINAIVESEDGFYLSEVDLEMRGPGELLGFKQHGVTELRLSDLVTDRDLAEITSKDAKQAMDPGEEARLFIRRHFSDGIVLFPN